MEGLVAGLGLSNRVVNRSIGRAIEWLEMDPLTLEGLQAAHDSLMETTATCDENDNGNALIDLIEAHASSLRRSTSEKDDDDLRLHDALHEWWTCRTDLYRALWVVSHLIVSTTIQQGIHPIHDDAKNDSTKVVRTTLLETIQTCQYILQHVLSTFGTKHGQRHHQHQHQHLPDSRYSLLAATLDVIQNDDDIMEYDAVMDPVDPIHSQTISEHDNIQSNETVTHTVVVSGNEPDEKDTNPHEEEDEEDECFFPMNPADWAAEEDELLDIALVPQKREVAIPQKKGKNHQKRYNHPRFVLVAKEGWLVWVRRNRQNGTIEERIRCLVRLYPVCGTLALCLEQHIPSSTTANKQQQQQQQGNVTNEETVAFFQIISANNEDEESKAIVCEPVCMGNTFHFQVLVRDRKGNNVPLILGVDEVTGGGLVEGCDWVTVLTNTIAEANQRSEAWHSTGTKRAQLTRHDTTSCTTDKDTDNDDHNPNTINRLRTSVVVNTATTATTTVQELISAMDILE